MQTLHFKCTNFNSSTRVTGSLKVATFFLRHSVDFLGYIFVTDSMGQSSVNLTHLTPKAAVLCKMTRNDG